MNIPTVGSRVRVTMHPSMQLQWDDIPPKVEVYEGTVVENQKWDLPASFCMTGDKYIGVRNIRTDMVTSVEYISGEARKVDIAGFRAFRVKSGSREYLVGFYKGRYKCTCVGFEYRKTCKHTQEVSKRMVK